ncbi:MAG: SHOCT domain-containing protein [Nitrospinales bacterium]
MNQFLIKNRPHQWAIFFLLAVFLFGLGCATTEERKIVKDGLTLQYISKDDAGSDVEKLRLKHPVNITEDMVRNHLLSLVYENLSLMGKKKYVFSGSDVQKIGALMTIGLKKSKPSNVLAFEWEAIRGITSGQVFATGRKLNWRFDKIQGVEFSSNMLRGWSSTWQMVPGKGQDYHVSKRLIMEKTWENWIEAAINLPPSKRLSKVRNQQPSASKRSPSRRKTAPPPSQPSQAKPSGPDPALEKKLEFLKNLREKNLIDDTEYERKRKDLLDKYL